MKKTIALFSIATLLISCSPSQEEVEKQEKEYDHIADSVLKESENYDDGVGSVTDSIEVKSDSLNLINKKN